jgi:hypothetical protein
VRGSSNHSAGERFLEKRKERDDGGYERVPSNAIQYNDRNDPRAFNRSNSL